MSMREQIDFKITAGHSDECRGIGWFFPGGWRNIGPTEQRDRAGRARGKRDGYLPDWFVLACNDPKCQARAAVPVSVITNLADSRDPSVRRNHAGVSDE